MHGYFECRAWAHTVKAGIEREINESDSEYRMHDLSVAYIRARRDL
jgi:hypothetical protein